MSYQSNLNWRKNIARRIERATDEEINAFITELNTEGTRLNNLAAEFGTNPEFIFDRSSLLHAIDHILESFQNPIQKQATVNALNEVG